MEMVAYEKSFASHEKSQYWSSKNGEIKPEHVYKSSGKKYWFDCPTCPHTFETKLDNITCLHRWCPYCSVPSKKLCDDKECIICYEKSFASHEKSQYWSSKNGDITPRNVLQSSNKKYWFDCSCNHTFDKLLSGVSGGGWCPYCANQKLCDNHECQSCFEKSFACHEKSIYWSHKNGDILPRNIFKSSGIKYWIDCPCSHTFDITMANLSSGYWCPYCSSPPQKLCADDKCQLCFDKSFASHEKSTYWSSKNGEIKPRDVFLSSSKQKMVFDCSKCFHSFDKIVSSITTNNSWCPYCAIPSKMLCNDQDCLFCHERSFASHEKSKHWSRKNVLIPRQVLKHSNKKYWMDCEKCKLSFEIALGHACTGNWCSFCKHKTEGKLYDKLLPTYTSIVTQFKQEWCRKVQELRFDFCILERHIIIELDGRQHFQQVQNWSSPQEQHENDLYKQQCANENGFSVIRILQEDVWNDTYDWCKALCDTIEEINTLEKVTNRYLCKHGEYDHFMQEKLI